MFCVSLISREYQPPDHSSDNIKAIVCVHRKEELELSRQNDIYVVT
jgi:hypothetical protein